MIKNSSIMEMVKPIPKINRVSMKKRITEKKTTIQDQILSQIIMINNRSIKIMIIII